MAVIAISIILKQMLALCLWSFIKPSLETELNQRIGKAASTFGNLQVRVWSNKKLKIHTKVQIYEACLLSILLYGCESWPTYSRQERRLNAFHLRCLRKISGVSWEDKVSDVRVLELSHSSNLWTVIRRRRLRWIGHLRRMDDSRIPKSILFGELAAGKRSVGHPLLRYKDSIKRDLKDFGITPNTWELLADDRASWRSSIKAGAARSALNFHDLRWRQHLARRRRINLAEDRIITQ